MKKNSIATHRPQEPKIQTAQGWQQKTIRMRQESVNHKATEVYKKENGSKNTEKK